MTYNQIIGLLKAGNCTGTIEGLELAVRQETERLRKPPTAWKPARALDSAREFYAEGISEQIANPLEPTPDRMLHASRFPATWAVAEVLRTNDLLKPKKPKKPKGERAEGRGPVSVHVKRDVNGKGDVGVVVTEAGFVFACHWAEDSELTEAKVREAWRTDRRAFRAYDESTGCYVDKGGK